MPPIRSNSDVIFLLVPIGPESKGASNELLCDLQIHISPAHLPICFLC